MWSATPCASGSTRTSGASDAVFQGALMSVYRVGVDIGGTFTDFVLVDERSGAMHFAKQLTTPRDPSVAVLAGVPDPPAPPPVPSPQGESLVHGTTLPTHA